MTTLSSLPILRLKNVSKRFSMPSLENNIEILSNINLSIAEGESIAIVGRSGSGKSTLLALMSTLDSPSEGEIWLYEHDLTCMNEKQLAAIRNQYIGFVFQNFQLIDNLNALENVLMPLELKNISNREKIAKQWLESVGLAHRMKSYPYQLSGGESQRVAIARAFAASPRILFVDEPTGSLDTTTGEMISKLLFDMNKKLKNTLILVTHDITLAQQCDRLIQIKEGQLHTYLPTDTPSHQS